MQEGSSEHDGPAQKGFSRDVEQFGQKLGQKNLYRLFFISKQSILEYAAHIEDH